jgi:hypothetical protein
MAGEAATAGDGDGVGCGSSFCAQAGRHALSEMVSANIILSTNSFPRTAF